MSDKERENESRSLERRDKHVRENRATDDPLSFMFDVDPTWASEYIILSQELNHLPFINDILHVSPRVVKIALLKPHRLIKLLDRKWSSDDPIESHAGELLPWSEYRDNAMRQWESPMENTWLVAELAEASECFHEGMTPLQAMMEIHSDCADGEENETVKIPSLRPLSVIGVIFVVAFVAILLKIYMVSATTHAAKLLAP